MNIVSAETKVAAGGYYMPQPQEATNQSAQVYFGRPVLVVGTPMPVTPGNYDPSLLTAWSVEHRFEPKPQARLINCLPHKRLRQPIVAFVEPDDDGFIARAKDLPLYGFGNDEAEALNALEHEIESLYDDLMADDNFTRDWMEIKAVLARVIES